MKTYIGAVVTTFALLVSPLSGLAADRNDIHTLPAPQPQTIEVDLDHTGEQVIQSVGVMSKYVYIGTDNLFHLKEQARKVVGQDVYNVYLSGVDSMNQAIAAGELYH